jgi:hypothetical protein
MPRDRVLKPLLCAPPSGVGCVARCGCCYRHRPLVRRFDRPWPGYRTLPRGYDETTRVEYHQMF